jgi:hypothetical protein
VSDEQTRLLQEFLELQKSHMELSQQQFDWENKSRNGARVGRIAIMFLVLVNAFALTMMVSEIKAMRSAIQSIQPSMGSQLTPVPGDSP